MRQVVFDCIVHPDQSCNNPRAYLVFVARDTDFLTGTPKLISVAQENIKASRELNPILQKISRYQTTLASKSAWLFLMPNVDTPDISWLRIILGYISILAKMDPGRGDYCHRNVRPSPDISSNFSSSF
jgi:hypothetical protein